MRRFLVNVFTWLAALGGVAVLLGLAYAWHERNGEQRAEEANPAEAPKRAANKIIKLGAELADSHGLADEPAVSVEWSKRLPAYGRVAANPRFNAEIRVPFAGTLRAHSGREWPALGSKIKAGETIGWLDVRFGPQERLDLSTKLNEAKARLRGADELVRIQLDRLTRLESASGGVPQSEIDAARTLLTESRTLQGAAKAILKEWEAASEAISRPGGRENTTWTQSLTVPAGGEVVELLARPGMAVEPGALVARVVDFRFALIRLELPPETLRDGAPAEVLLIGALAAPPAFEGASNRAEPATPARTLAARLSGAAGQVEIGSQYAAYWYEADTADSIGSWRPGSFVQAQVSVPGAPAGSAVAVPFASLLYHQGRALVYVRLSPGRYERREVQVLGRDGDKWALATGVAAGERVVSKRAQILLSEEFRGEADND